MLNILFYISIGIFILGIVLILGYEFYKLFKKEPDFNRNRGIDPFEIYQ